MENRHKYLLEHRDNLRADRTALRPVPTSNTFRVANQMCRHISLPGRDPRYTTQLVAYHIQGQE